MNRHASRREILSPLAREPPGSSPWFRHPLCGADTVNGPEAYVGSVAVTLSAVLFAPWRRVFVEEILVVDDEWELAEVMIYLLQSEGYRAQYAPHGEIALQLLSKSPAQLVLTDYMMPVMNVCELLQTILSRKDLAGTPVIMVSALPEDLARNRCKLVKAFLRKPFTADQLLRLVRSTLGPPQRDSA